MSETDSLGSTGRLDLPLKQNGKRWNARTSYEPSDCDTLLSMMREGCTYNEVAREIGVSVKTMKNWCSMFPEFNDAYEMGRDWAQGWYEKQAREHLIIESFKDGPQLKFDTKNYIFTMGARFKISDKQPEIRVEVDNDTDVDKTIDLVQKLHKETI